MLPSTIWNSRPDPSRAQNVADYAGRISCLTKAFSGGCFIAAMNVKTNSADGLRILVVDDNPYDAELIQTALQDNLDCQVITLATRGDFVEALAQKFPDVVISDSNLPTFSGAEAFNMVQRMCPHVPFIFCSGNNSPEMKKGAITLGAKDWVSKNDLDVLVQSVRRVVNEQTG